jgi:uncharacterized protein YcsI (UPF0317 family)
VQANLAILPADWASEFLLFCQKNPKPCPVLAVTNPGDPIFPTLGNDVDVRTDAPRYKVFRDGVIVDKPTDLRDIWRDDLVAFAIGCSFSFEEALIETGLRIRHLEQGLNVPMYISSHLRHSAVARTFLRLRTTVLRPSAARSRIVCGPA